MSALEGWFSCATLQSSFLVTLCPSVTLWLRVCSASSASRRCSSDKQRRRNKIQNKRPTLPNPLQRQRIHFQQRLHQRRGAKIKNNYSHHRGQEIHRIHHPKFLRLNALP